MYPHGAKHVRAAEPSNHSRGDPWGLPGSYSGNAILNQSDDGVISNKVLYGMVLRDLLCRLRFSTRWFPIWKVPVVPLRNLFDC